MLPDCLFAMQIMMQVPGRSLPCAVIPAERSESRNPATPYACCRARLFTADCIYWMPACAGMTSQIHLSNTS
jgi:hypothetical protein